MIGMLTSMKINLNGQQFSWFFTFSKASLPFAAPTASIPRIYSRVWNVTRLNSLSSATSTSVQGQFETSSDLSRSTVMRLVPRLPICFYAMSLWACDCLLCMLSFNDFSSLNLRKLTWGTTSSNRWLSNMGPFSMPPFVTFCLG